jgi:hypothetical protein
MKRGTQVVLGRRPIERHPLAGVFLEGLAIGGHLVGSSGLFRENERLDERVQLYGLVQQPLLQPVLYPVSESAAQFGIVSSTQGERKGWNEDRTEELGVFRYQYFQIPVTFVVSPCRIWKRGKLTSLYSQVLELTCGNKWRNQLAAPERMNPDHHPLAFIFTNLSRIDHFRKHIIGMVKKIGNSPDLAIITDTRKHNYKAATTAQFAGPQRKKRLPVLRGLVLKCRMRRVFAEKRNEMIWNQRWYTA